MYSDFTLMALAALLLFVGAGKQRRSPRGTPLATTEARVSLRLATCWA